MVRVGLVGCGTIGSQLALAVQRKYPAAARMSALHDVDCARAVALQRRLRSHPPIVSLPALVRKSDLVIEAASAGIALDVVQRALRAKRSVLVMSVGGLLRSSSWRRLARRAGATVHIPSGALAGLDGVKAMAVGRIRRVSLTTRKPPRAFAGSPYVRRTGLVLERLRSATLLFEGPPGDAVKAFPQNTNVAAALALASGAPHSRIRIRVVADPAIRRNTHELEVQGDGGRVRCTMESRPSANPKTSEMAVRSAVATLARIVGSIAIGT